MVKKARLSLVLFVIIVTICLQMTDVKIANIKISEMLMLLIFPFLLRRRINKYAFLFILLFSIYLLITLTTNLNREFYLATSELSLLKLPYLISVSRYLELLACVSFLLFVIDSINSLSRYYSQELILESVLKANLFVSWFFLLIYLYYLLTGKVLESDSFVVHNVEAYNPLNYRLRGLYFEGGPFGLFYSVLFVLSTFLPGRNIVMKLTFFAIVLLAKSKAGLSFVLFWFLYNLFVNYKVSTSVKFLAILIFVPFFLLGLKMIAANYVEVFQNIEREVADKPDDFGLVMGRVSGMFIVPKMLLSNPIFGIGLGNYPLVRNSPDYLGIFPYVPHWDEHGLGGLVSLAVEGGLLILGLFTLILTRIYLKLKQWNRAISEIILLFIIPTLLGVQLHFMYIWYVLGVILALLKSYDNLFLKLKGF